VSAFDGERALVIGLGVSGGPRPRECLLEEGASVRISESGSVDSASGAASVRDLDVEILDGGNDPAHLADVTLVVTSPGVPQDAPIMPARRSTAAVPVWSELRARRATSAAFPTSGSTGTNGKNDHDGDARRLDAGGRAGRRRLRQRSDIRSASPRARRTTRSQSRPPRSAALLGVLPSDRLATV
jgi:hypothetical protein